MKTNFSFPAAVAFTAFFAIVFSTNVMAQDTYDWTQTPEYQKMYQDAMRTVENSYNNSYNQHAANAQKIMDKQKEDEQRMYQEMMQMVTESYEATYTYWMSKYEEIIANANANAKKMEAELIARGQAVYQQALAQGMSNAKAQTLAVNTIGNLASTSDITNSFGHSLTMQIMNNFPNGSGALYKYADGTYGNWATRY